MKAFTQLFTKIEETNQTVTKVAALEVYFEQSTDEDKLWAMALLSQRRPKRTITASILKKLAIEVSGIPNWLFEESYQMVGDVTETVSLILPAKTVETDYSLTYWIDYINHMSKLTQTEKKENIKTAWTSLGKDRRYIFNKLITGSFRMNVSQQVMITALSNYTKREESILSPRFISNWTPETTTFQSLMLSQNASDDISKPYPFYCPKNLEKDISTLGNPKDWQAERKWDGIRAQIIIRNDAIFVWTDEAVLVTDKFPEYKQLLQTIPNGTVLDGVILAFKDNQPLGVNAVHTRIGRKRATKKQLQATPMVFLAYDLLEWEGKDIREQSLVDRRKQLEALVQYTDAKEVLLFSDIIPFTEWETLTIERINSRKHHAKGVVIKKKNAPYHSDIEENWWQWNVPPLIVDAVMIYAQKGKGATASLYTEYTFAVWEANQLIPFTKATASNLSEEEILTISQFVKKNTVERFGPVRSVVPALVFEIAFDGIEISKRHKSGITLNNSILNCWKKDYPLEKINTLKDLKKLL